MSAWRLVVRALHDAGGEATSRELDRRVGSKVAVPRALGEAARLGLVSHPGRCGSSPKPWTLTEIGRNYAEGRLKQTGNLPGGRRWVATWLSSLPRDIRLAQGQA